MEPIKCKARGCKGSGYRKQTESEKAEKAKADEKLAEILAKRRAEEENWAATAIASTATAAPPRN
jgi:hypothetical protein